MKELNIQQAYEKFFKEYGEVCKSGYEESNRYYIFTPEKYMEDGSMDGISYKVDKYSGEISEYTYLEYLEDTKKYNENNWPVGISVKQPQKVSRAS